MQILPSRSSPCLSVTLDLVKDLQVSNGAMPCRPQVPLHPCLCSPTGLSSPSPETWPQPLPVGPPAHPACRLPSLTDHGPRHTLGPSGAVRHSPPRLSLPPPASSPRPHRPTGPSLPSDPGVTSPLQVQLPAPWGHSSCPSSP